LRAGMPGDFRCDRCEYSCAFYTTTSHTRLRVHWAPGIPHALFWAEIHQSLGRIAQRELNACLEAVHVWRPSLRANGSRERAPRWLAMTIRKTLPGCLKLTREISAKPLDPSYATLPSTISRNTRRTSAWVSFTRACSEEKSGASPARAMTRSRSSPALSGLKCSLTQSRRIWVRS